MSSSYPRFSVCFYFYFLRLRIQNVYLLIIQFNSNFTTTQRTKSWNCVSKYYVGYEHEPLHSGFKGMSKTNKKLLKIYY